MKPESDGPGGIRPADTVMVEHRASNLANKHAILKQGFVFTHARSKLWPDGQTEDDYHYELKV